MKIAAIGAPVPAVGSPSGVPVSPAVRRGAGERRSLLGARDSQEGRPARRGDTAARLLGTPATSPRVPTVPRGAAPHSPVRVAAEPSREALAARVDALCERWSRPGSPGCVVAVMRGDETIFQRAYGMADLERGVPLSHETVFRIASASKQFTAYCVLRLAEDGLLSLDDEIHQHLPGLPPTPAPVTVRQLLHHTGGLREYLELFELAGYQDQDPLTSEQVWAALCRQRGVNDPSGRRFLYSNTGYYLLGRIAERVSGKSLPELAAELIFEPLGMSRTRFGESGGAAATATAYAGDGDGGFRRTGSGSAVLGDGGLRTTVGDMCRWERYLDAPPAEARATVRLMEQPGRLRDGTPLEYACGLELGTLGGRRLVSHSGSFAGFRAEALRIPEESLTVVCLANTNEASPAILARQIAGFVLEPDAAAEEVAPAAWGPGAAREWAGFYRDPETGLLAAVRSREGQLELHLPGGQFALLPVAEGTWLADDGVESFEVQPRRHGGSTGWTLAVGGAYEASYDAVPATSPRAVPLAALQGRYTSTEVGATYQVTAERDRLRLTLGSKCIGVFEPVKDDLFWAAGMTLAFDRDGEGQLTGFRLSTNGARGLWFARDASSAPARSAG